MYRKPALDEASQFTMLNERLRETRYHEKWLCLLRSGVPSKRALDLSGVRVLSILLAHCKRSPLLGFQWIKHSLTLNDHHHSLILFFKFCAPVHAFLSLCFLVLRSFARVFSSFFPHSNHAGSCCIFIEILSPFFTPPLHFASFEQLRCQLINCFYSRSRSLLDWCCFALFYLVVVRLC